MSAARWLGIDVGGTYLKWEQIGANGASVAAGRVPTPSDGEQAVAEALAEIIRSRLDLDHELSGVGIAVPGHLAIDRQSITLLPNVAGIWVGFPLVDWLQERTSIRAVLLNDARAFAVAELTIGAARGAEDAVFAVIGTGVGGAVAVGGRVISTPRDAFGEVGHTVAVVDGELCGCGGRGCVEAYAGGSSVLRRAMTRGIDLRSSATALLDLHAASDEDLAAEAVLEEAYDAFAVGIAAACAFTGARVVVVGGAVAVELPGYLARTRYRLQQRRALLGEVDVRLAHLGSRAGAIGAALTANMARQTESHHFPFTSNSLEHHA